MNNSNFLFTYETYDRTPPTRLASARQHVVAQQNATCRPPAPTRDQCQQGRSSDALRVNSGADLQLSAATRPTKPRPGQPPQAPVEATGTSQHRTRSVTSSLKAGKALELTASKTATQGAELKSAGDIQLAARQVDITSASRTRAAATRLLRRPDWRQFLRQNGDGDKGKTLHRSKSTPWQADRQGGRRAHQRQPARVANSPRHQRQRLAGDRTACKTPPTTIATATTASSLVSPRMKAARTSRPHRRRQQPALGQKPQTASAK